MTDISTKFVIFYYWVLSRTRFARAHDHPLKDISVPLCSD